MDPEPNPFSALNAGSGSGINESGSETLLSLWVVVQYNTFLGHRYKIRLNLLVQKSGPLTCLNGSLLLQLPYLRRYGSSLHFRIWHLEKDPTLLGSVKYRYTASQEIDIIWIRRYLHTKRFPSHKNVFPHLEFESLKRFTTPTLNSDPKIDFPPAHLDFQKE